MLILFVGSHRTVGRPAGPVRSLDARDDISFDQTGANKTQHCRACDKFIIWDTPALYQVAHTIEPGEIQDHNPWWKARKWASRIISRMFEKFGTSKSIQSEDPDRAAALTQFAKWFGPTLSLPLLQGTMMVLQ